MFLATTALDETWPAGGPVLFLGEWCKLYASRSRWSALDYVVCPYHWDDREALWRDYHAIVSCYEKYLAALSLELNRLHGTNHSPRYWRILIGPWLSYFIGILFDRFASLKRAATEFNISGTYVLAELGGEAPTDFFEFARDCVTDIWNHYLYGEIIKLTALIPYTEVSRSDRTDAPGAGSIADRMVRGAKYLVRVAEYYGRARRVAAIEPVFFCDTYFSAEQIRSLKSSLGQSGGEFPPGILSISAQIKSNMRESLKMAVSSNEFERVLESLLAKQIPRVYVEGYSRARSLAKTIFPKRVKRVLTANAYAANELFKVWVAEQLESGAALDVVQHGGNIGAAKWEQLEEHQLSICDRFYSWGWTDKSTKVRVASAPKLIGLKDAITGKKSGDVLLVVGSIPRYSYRMFSAPISSQYLAYLDDLLAFMAALNPEVINKTKALHYPDNYGWGVAERFRDAGFDGKVEVCRNFRERLVDASACISTFNTTTFLETLVANIPTLVFWRPEMWELREAAVPYYTRLREVGILHDAPESAAAHLNKWHGRLESWWASQDVQVAREEFCRRFAYCDSAWLKEWSATLSGD